MYGGITVRIEKVMVIGAGQMGSGIAQVFAQAGYQVLLNDIHEKAVQSGKQQIEKFLNRDVERGRRTELETEEALQRIKTSTDLTDGKDADFFIEAVVEKIDVKKKVFKALDDLAKPEAIFASNTSSLSITEMAAVTKRSEQFIGMHFMNPVPVMKLVEIIRGLQTKEETFQIVKALTKKLSKTPVEVEDYPGFASNRILMPMINEAIYALYEGVASVDDIDTVMKLGMNHPMGPLQLADFIGLDTCLYIMEVLHEGLGDSKYRPCPLLRKYVQAGWLGRKSGRGFYIYD